MKSTKNAKTTHRDPMENQAGVQRFPENRQRRWQGKEIITQGTPLLRYLLTKVNTNSNGKGVAVDLTRAVLLGQDMDKNNVQRRTILLF